MDPENRPDVREPRVIPCSLEERQGGARERSSSSTATVFRKLGAVRRGSHARPAARRCVSGRVCTLRRRFGNRGALCRVAFCERAREIEFGHHVNLRRPGQGEGALEEADSGAIVASPGGGAAGSRETRPCAFGQRRVGLAELLLVSRCLLEVVAENLVSLDRLAAALFDPACVALVQVRAHGLRQGAVGRVSDEQVAKTEAVLTGQLGLLGANQLSPCECSEAGRQLQSSGTRT